MKALEGFNTGLASEATKPLAGLDTHHEVLKALEGFNTGLASEATGSRWRGSTRACVSEALKALPRLDAALFGEAWDERLAAAVGRLDRAEDIITAASEPERAVEALATDMDDRERGRAARGAGGGPIQWVQWFWIYLAQKLFLDPALDPAVEQVMEAAVARWR